MKRTVVLLLLTFLLFSFSACDKSNRKMDGFTPTELAEYISSIDGLHQIRTEKKKIPCGDLELYVDPGHIINDPINLYELFCLERWTEPNWMHPDGVPYLTHITMQNLGMDTKPVHDLYLGTPPNNFAYYLEAFNFNSFPHWTTWVNYDIPINFTHKKPAHGQFHCIWYNIIENEFHSVIYFRENENSTELYIVYQEISLFRYKNKSSWSPYLISEQLYEKIRTDYLNEETYTKGTIQEFSNWFMSEYMDEIPPAFADIKAEYVYYGTDGLCGTNGLYSKKFLASEYNDPSIFYEDMKTLGVNFDELRSYIIKVTVPHDGTVQDIFWELIG